MSSRKKNPMDIPTSVRLLGEAGNPTDGSSPTRRNPPRKRVARGGGAMEQVLAYLDDYGESVGAGRSRPRSPQHQERRRPQSATTRGSKKLSSKIAWGGQRVVREREPQAPRMILDENYEWVEEEL